MNEPPVQLALPVAPPAAPSLAGFVGAAHAEVLARLRRLLHEGRGRVWLTGPAGSGKSHLLCAALRELQDERGAAAAQRARVETLGDTLAGLAHGDPQRGAVLLCMVDDADHAAGDARAEAALMQLYNEHTGALLLAGRQHPGAAPWVLPDLRSRLLAAEQYRLSAIGDADRAALLRARAASVGLHLEDDVLQYLLTRLPRDAANLLHVMDRLDMASWRAQRRLTVPFVRAVLELEG